MSTYCDSIDDEDRPEPCDHCEPKLLKIAVGNTYKCPEYGVEWVADPAGVWPADEVPDDGIHPETREMDDVEL